MDKIKTGIEYRELITDHDFEQCIDIQRDVFGFSDKDLVSPLFFKLIARNQPPIGTAMGVFRTNEKKNNELLGFILGFATYLENSIYVVLLAIKKEFQNGVLGYKLLLNFREFLLTKGISTLFGVYEPLEANLARLYCHSFGYKGIKYFPDLTNNTLPSDKLYVVWELNSKHTNDRIHRANRTNPEEAIKKFRIIENDFTLNDETLLMEIPENFLKIKKNNHVCAIEWRNKTRIIFNEFITKRNYFIDDCICWKTATGKKFYYILKKV